MAARPSVGADAELNASNWVSGAQQVKSSAADAQDAIDKLIKSLDQAQAAIGLSGTTSVKATVDTSDIEAAVSLRSLLEDPTSFVASAEDSDIDSAVDVQNELNEPTDFVANANDSELRSAVGLHDDLNAPANTRVNVNDAELDGAKRKRDDLESLVDTRVNVNDSELDTAKRKRDDVGGDVDIKAKVDSSEIDSLLRQIRDMQAVEFGVGVGGAAKSGIEAVFGFSIGGILEMDTAMKTLEGTTGRSIPGARELIVDLYTGAWGESRAQIASVIALASNLGVAQKDMAEAVQAAFELADITGYEAEETIKTLEVMVRTGLASTYTEAGDIVVAAFQAGGDRYKDLLDTFIEYTPNFNDLRLTGEETANAIIGGIKGGFMGSDFAADALREFGIRIGTDFSDEIQATLADIDMLDEAELFRQGEIDGAELIHGVIQGIDSLPVAEQPAAAAILFGTKVEDFSLNAMRGLDPLIDHIGGIQDRLHDSANVIYSDFNTAFTTLKRSIEVEFENFLVDTFDIDALLDNLTTAINTFFSELSAGESIFGAAEEAFGLGGLEETMQTIQRIFAEMAIGILEAVASIAEFFKKNDLAEDIRGVVADISEIQLGADIFAADSQEQLASSLARALKRGVDEADIQDAIVTQFEALRDSGDLTGALDFIDTIAATEGLEIFNTETLRSQIIRDINTSVNEALASGDLVTAIQNAPTESVKEAIRQSMANSLATGVREGFDDAETRLQALDYAAYLNPAANGVESAMGLIGTDAAAELVGNLLADFNGALETGDLDLAGRIADALDSVGLQAKVDEMRESISTIADTSDETAEEFGTDTEAIAADMDDARAGIDRSVAGSVLRMIAMALASAVMQSSIGTKLGAMATDWVDTSGVVGDETGKMSDSYDEAGKLMGETHDKLGEDSSALVETIAANTEAIATDFDALMSSVAEDGTLISDVFTRMSEELSLWREISVTGFVEVGDEFSRLVDRFQTNAGRLSETLDSIVSDFADAGTLTLPVSVGGGGGGGSNVTNNSSVTNNNNVSVNTSNGATVSASLQNVSNAVRNG